MRPRRPPDCGVRPGLRSFRAGVLEFPATGWTPPALHGPWPPATPPAAPRWHNRLETEKRRRSATPIPFPSRSGTHGPPHLRERPETQSVPEMPAPWPDQERRRPPSDEIVSADRPNWHGPTFQRRRIPPCPGNKVKETAPAS